jgi:hypothetical protein
MCPHWQRFFGICTSQGARTVLISPTYTQMIHTLVKDLNIQHIREFEQIQLEKEKAEIEENTMEIDGATGAEIIEENIENAEIIHDESEDEDDEMEVEEQKDAKHSEEVLKKVYTHLHLVIRPKLSKLITPRHQFDPTAEGNKNEVNTPLASALISVLIKLGNYFVEIFEIFKFPTKKIFVNISHYKCIIRTLKKLQDKLKISRIFPITLNIQ